MAHVSPYNRIEDARPKHDQGDERAIDEVSHPKTPLVIFFVAAVVTLLAMVAVLFSPLYPSPKIGIGLAFVVAAGFLVLYVTARKAAIIRGKR